MRPIAITHASVRTERRGAPQLAMNWLLEYGEETFDGRGGVVRYFTPRSIRQLEREVCKRHRRPGQQRTRFMNYGYSPCYIGLNETSSLMATVIGDGGRLQSVRQVFGFAPVNRTKPPVR
jgi:hypothetical protein